MRVNSKPEDIVSWDIDIPLAGNAWIVDDPSASADLIRETGLTGWSDPVHTVGVYFHLSHTGSLQLAMRARVQSGASELQCTLAGKTKTIILNNTDWQLIPIGTFEVTQPGYQRLDLRGVNRTGPEFAEVETVFITGEAAQGEVHYIKDEFYWGRRGPSVHLWYPQADPIPQVEWFYNEVTVPEGQDVIGSYFMANGFGEGYFGFQVNSNVERRILFSVWSPFQTDNPNDIPEDQKIVLLKKGPDVYTGEFGNEGSGGQSYLRYPWRAGNTYRFLLRGHPSTPGHTDYTAWFFAPETGNWQLIASWRRPQTNTYLTGLYSFLENFIPETGVISRFARYGNQWVRDTGGQWHELTEARFTADATARKGNRLDYQGGLQNNAFVLHNCGFFSETTAIDTDFKRTATGKTPALDLDALP
ncbi:MAG: DUF3472 domain-containing protein [Lewinella sp.]|nr:DUF3472 domain-containing protein [Lewinella sp.]